MTVLHKLPRSNTYLYIFFRDFSDTYGVNPIFLPRSYVNMWESKPKETYDWENSTLKFGYLTCCLIDLDPWKITVPPGELVVESTHKYMKDTIEKPMRK